MKQKNSVLFWLGGGIVVLTHLFMLAYGLQTNQMTIHAVSNLVGVGLIMLGVKK